MTYRAPLEAIAFTLKHVAGLDALTQTGAYPDLSDDLIAAVLGEAGKLAEEVLGPLNKTGDAEGCQFANGSVTTPKGFREAYRLFSDGGWAGLAATPEFGGQGLPAALDVAAFELWASSNMAFSLCPMLTRGAIVALTAHGTPEQQAMYLPKLISGAWTGTMNLTEPQAGSDVGALKAKAEPVGDGTYRISGAKIFITWGEHDVAENIVHLVLARLPGAPEGTRGISLFVVPKFLVGKDGALGARNDLRCVSIEHKLGIHGSPTCVMSYGEKDGAIGTLIGEPNRGMACMFTMMNDARLNVGVQGLAVAERALQQALAFAEERRQGGRPIVEHPDVRRMLATMRAEVEVARGLCFTTAVALDLSHTATTAAAREAARAKADLLTPIAKAWSTEIGVAVASLGIQVHGGMGYIEETGAAQYLRDARIAPIYEGTNGIQAIDLVTRKLARDRGRAANAFIDDIEATARRLDGDIGPSLARAAQALRRATAWMVERQTAGAQEDALAGATPYLELFGQVAGGHVLGLGALAPGAEPWRGALARFYAASRLAGADGLSAAATAGAATLSALEAAGLRGGA